MHSLPAAHEPMAFAINVVNIKELQSADSLQRSYTMAASFAQEILTAQRRRHPQSYGMAWPFKRPGAERPHTVLLQLTTGDGGLYLQVRYCSMVAEHAPSFIAWLNVGLKERLSCLLQPLARVCTVRARRKTLSLSMSAASLCLPGNAERPYNCTVCTVLECISLSETYRFIQCYVDGGLSYSHCAGMAP